MALSQQAVESMLSAMNIIATNQVNAMSYDQTVICTIVDNKKASKEFYYTVTDGSIKFKAYVLTQEEAKEYDIDDQVYVKVPNGDYTKQKYIEGYYISEKTPVPIAYKSPLDSFLSMENLMANADGTQTVINEGLIANYSSEIPLWQWQITDSEKNSSDDLQANGIYDTLGLQADFKCLLDTYDMRSGTYGLRLDLYVRLSQSSDKHIKKSIYLDSTEMFGNPYAYSIFATQAKTFDLASIGTIDGMTLWFYQNNDFTYFDGETEKYLEVDQQLLVENILVKNIYIAFGGDLSVVTDNTVKLYTINTQTFRFNEPNDTNNKKTLGFLWYNKTEENEYIGFSDGIVDFKRNSNGQIINPSSPEIDPYDELNYIELSTYDSNLVAQMGKDVPTDKNGLEVSANVEKAKSLLKSSYLLIQTDLVNTLKAFKERVNGINIKQNSNTYITATDFFSAKDTGKIEIASKYGTDLETYTDNFVTQMAKAFSAAAAIQKHQTEKTKPTTVVTYTNMNLYSSTIKNLLQELTSKFYTVSGGKRTFLFEALKNTIATEFSGFQDIYDLYVIKLDKIFTKLEANFVEIDTLIKDAESKMTSSNKEGETSTRYKYLLGKPIDTYVKKDFSNYDNRYCVYWYRYKEGYEDPDKLMDDGWERITPEMVFKNSSYSTTSIPKNLGLSTGYFEKKGVSYFLPKPTDGEGYLTVYLNPELEEEKFKVVIYYNHERFISNELVFKNLDPIPDKTTLDSNDAIVINHGRNSFDSYQTLYAQNNSLINKKEGSAQRELTVKYTGVLGGNENLAGAQIFWYIPRNATMLSTNVNRLKSTDYGFSTDYYRTAKVLRDIKPNQGPGIEYKVCSESYKKDDIIESVYDFNNDWYSLRSSNSIGASGRWLHKNNIEIVTNKDTYMDGYACFYKTIPFEEKEVDVYDETDPTKVIGKKTIQEVDEKDLTFFYTIKDYYVSTFLKNTIFCIIKKGSYKFEASISFIFGTQGTSGTDYTVIITPSDTSTSVIGTNLLPVHIKAYDYDNEEMEIFANSAEIKDGTLYNPKIAWFGPTTFSMAAFDVDAAAGSTKIVNAGEFSQLTDRVKGANGQFNYCGIAKFTVDMWDTSYGGAKQLTTFYPVAWSSDKYFIEGATSVVYDSQGGNPAYYKGAYKIFNTDDNSEKTNVKWDIKYFMLNSAANHGYAPAYMFDKTGKIYQYNNSAWKQVNDASLSKEVEFYLTCMPTLNESNKLVPCNTYISGTYNEATKTWSDLNAYPVVCCYDKTSNNQLWAQPIAINQNRYPNSMLNHWDGKFTIDEENGTILSTMVAAGFKNTDNTYSGVIMGDIEAGTVSSDNKDGIGVYGYHHGGQSFGLNIDGTAFFGKSGRGRIQINGNSGTIASASYFQTETAAGMLIDLDDGVIDIRGTKISGGKYTSDTTYSHIRLNANPKNDNDPYFQITAPHDLADSDEEESVWVNKDLLFISRTDYFLQTENYLPMAFNIANGSKNATGQGMKIDLKNGKIDAYDFQLTSNNIYLNSTTNRNGANTPYLIVKDSETYKNLLYISDEAYYLQTANYNSTNKIGTKINLKSGTITSYDFTLNAWTSNGGIVLRSTPTTSQNYIKIGNTTDYIQFSDDKKLKIMASDFTLTSGNTGTTNFLGLYSNNPSTYTNINGCNTNTWRIIAGNSFGVTSAGNLYATGATITGNIYADYIHTTNGSIGGWTIGPGYISGGSTHLYSNGSISTSKIKINADGTLTGPGANLTNLSVTGTLSTTGNTTIGGSLGVNSTTSITGNTTIGGKLTVNGTTAITGNTTIGGSLTINTTSFKVGNATAWAGNGATTIIVDAPWTDNNYQFTVHNGIITNVDTYESTGTDIWNGVVDFFTGSSTDATTVTVQSMSSDVNTLKANVKSLQSHNHILPIINYSTNTATLADGNTITFVTSVWYGSYGSSYTSNIKYMT